MITKELLKSIAIEQSQEIAKRDKGIVREKIKEIEDKINLKHAIIITGIRRCGKSTLLTQIMEKYYIENDYYYFNFDDERIIDFKTEHLNLLLEVFIETFGDRKIFFFDEIQNVNGWELFISRLYSQNYKFIITGSNAKLLSTELATHLTGRHIDLNLFPFSFKEFLRYNNFEVVENDFYITERRALISKYLKEYLLKGGFPERIIYDNKYILKNLYDDILYKDVALRFKIKDIQTIRELAYYLMSNNGKYITYNKIKNEFDLGSVHTAKNYVQYLTTAFLFFELNIFSYSTKQQIGNPKKIYAIDNGLANEISFKFSENLGRLYENVVFLELKRRNKEVYYWKDNNGKEVDFVIREVDKIANILQVCYNIQEKETREREVKGLINALEKFKLKEGVIITEDEDGEEKFNGKTIKYIPLWKFLLR